MDVKIQESIRKVIQNHFSEMQNIRRQIHQNPELSFEEFETARFIEKQLTILGLSSTRMAKTGVVGYLGDAKKGKTLALRADIDALPIHEKNNTEYVSKNKGVMHACGHDVHTTWLLGALKALKAIENHLSGQIKFIFQPGEEKIPGGASLLIQEGVLNDVDFILGQHTMPLLDVGHFGFRSGLYMASADEIYIRIHGKGGHGAHPNSLVDPVTCMAQIINALQQVVSRKAKPSIPSVLSFGKVIANGATNIVPDSVEMIGTFRTYDEAWRFEAHNWIKKIAANTAVALGCETEIEIKVGYPFLENNTSMNELVKKNAKAWYPQNQIHELELWPAGEDFSFYAQEIPAVFYRCGIRNIEKGITSHLHTPTFDIDEKALVNGAEMMAWQAYKLLQENEKIQ